MSPILGEPRGVALPMALLSLLLLTSLSLAIVSLAQTEPTIASNHLLAVRARALAESGIERALWALTNATVPDGFGGTGDGPNVVIAATAASPYDGSAFVTVGSAGGFRLTVTGADPNRRLARSIGWSPTEDRADPRAKSRSELTATLVRVRNLAREVPCALCVASALSLTSSVVDARGSETTDCGAKVGATAATSLELRSGTRIFGAGAPDDSPSSVEGRDWRRHQAFTVGLARDDLETLKSVAILRGTYVRPPSDARIELSGLPSGVVFVDSPAGTHAVSATNLANVAVGPRFAAATPFRGWLVVNGDVTLEAGADIEGLVYAANGLVTEGPATVTGAIVVRQALGASGVAAVDLSVRFDCAAARGSGLLPSGWFVRLGSYCDEPGGC
jgi:hypothetical protein